MLRDAKYVADRLKVQSVRTAQAAMRRIPGAFQIEGQGQAKLWRIEEEDFEDWLRKKRGLATEAVSRPDVIPFPVKKAA